MPKKASSLSAVPDEYMRCRAFRKHPEIRIHDTVIRNTRRKVVAFIRREHCPYCERDSETLYSLPDWTIVWRRTRYPDDYQVEGGVGALECKQEFERRLGGTVDEEPKETAEEALTRKARIEKRRALREQAKDDKPARKKTAAARPTTKTTTKRQA